MSTLERRSVGWPTRGHHYLRNEIENLSALLADSDRPLSQASEVKAFEDAFSTYTASPHAFALMSCAHALDLAATLINIQPGDEVVLPAHTYCATALAFARRGANLVWADISLDSLTIDADSAIGLITPRTKAVVIVHLYGRMAPATNQLVSFCKERGIFTVEDCAQALGAKSNEQSVGTFGDIGCFSFHSQKNLTTLGEGGMIVTSTDDFADKILGMRLNGHRPFTQQEKYWLPAMVNVDQDIEGEWPLKSTLSEAQGLVGRLVLERLDSMIAERRSRAHYLKDTWSEISEFSFQSGFGTEEHSHHLMPVRIQSSNFTRNDLIEMLYTDYGIRAIAQYRPLNQYDLFVKAGFGQASSTENSALYYDQMVSFPFSLTQEFSDLVYIASSTKECVTRLVGRQS